KCSASYKLRAAKLLSLSCQLEDCHSHFGCNGICFNHHHIKNWSCDVRFSFSSNICDVHCIDRYYRWATVEKGTNRNCVYICGDFCHDCSFEVVYYICTMGQ